MSGLNRRSQRFIAAYRDLYPTAAEAAKLACVAVERALADTGAFVHVISGRAKKPESLLGKLRRKKYYRPSSQLTDLIGVRVITYYRDSVDPIVSRLRQEFEINENASVDKRRDLGLHDFGYSSVHLIARLKQGQVLTTDHQFIRKRWFEIQIRTVLEHAWSEIEHEVVYKSGIKYPDETKRRFARLAGSLELLDSEFLALREQRDVLVNFYRASYANNVDSRKPFDVARLLGFLEAARPNGQGWRSSSAGGLPFGAGLELCCLEALKTVGLGTAVSLHKLFRSAKFQSAVQSFAASEGIAPAEVSHLAAVVIAVAVKNAGIVQRHFPEIIYDPSIMAMIEKRVHSRGRS